MLCRKQVGLFDVYQQDPLAIAGPLDVTIISELPLGLDGAGWLEAPQALRAVAFWPGITRGREGWAVP